MSKTKIGLIILALVCAPLVFKVVLMPLWFAGRTVDVVKQELDPAFLLKKYEWFKDVSAQLGKKQADISVFRTRFCSLDGLVRGGTADRSDKENWQLQQTELAGVVASFNGLAAEYNAQMAKLNWRFTNVGMLPEGATEPMQREFATYQETFSCVS